MVVDKVRAGVGRWNGGERERYTDALANDIKPRLDPEGLEWTNDGSEPLKFRRNTLPKAVDGSRVQMQQQLYGLTMLEPKSPISMPLPRGPSGPVCGVDGTPQ
jgi:hypothetical protein